VSLDVVAVEGFTRGRLNRDDDETQRQLDAALAAARNYCGWHVSPVAVGEQITLDGTGTSVLVLPTLKVTDLIEVEEDGATLELTDLSWSERGLILKKSGHWWSAMFRSITVTFSHGYSSAPDFDSVILSAIERGAFSSDSAPRVIGPFQYSDPGNADAVLFTDSERAVLDRYALEKTP